MTKPALGTKFQITKVLRRVDKHSEDGLRTYHVFEAVEIPAQVGVYIGYRPFREGYYNTGSSIIHETKKSGAALIVFSDTADPVKVPLDQVGMVYGDVFPRPKKARRIVTGGGHIGESKNV